MIGFRNEGGGGGGGGGGWGLYLHVNRYWKAKSSESSVLRIV